MGCSFFAVMKLISFTFGYLRNEQTCLCQFVEYHIIFVNFQLERKEKYN